MPLRLACYNILEGLQPSPRTEGDTRALDQARVEAARTVVAELASDILVLNEALYCQPHEGRYTDFAALFGFPHQASALYDGAWGNAILSRYPVFNPREMRIYNRGGLIADIETPLGLLTVATYHPHPWRAAAHKADDFVRLIADISGPAVVCGDFNAICPEDALDRPAMLSAFRRFSPEPEETLERFIRSGEQVFDALGRLGFADAVPLAGRRFSIPTDLISTMKDSGMRIDHVVVSSDIRVIAGGVLQSAASNRASDHHPVWIEFEVIDPETCNTGVR